jgi:hypothetical protein
VQWLFVFPCLAWQSLRRSLSVQLRLHLDFLRLQNSSREVSKKKKNSSRDAYKKQDPIRRAKPLPLESCRFLPAISFLYIATSLPRFPRPQPIRAPRHLAALYPRARTSSRRAPSFATRPTSSRQRLRGQASPALAACPLEGGAG